MTSAETRRHAREVLNTNSDLRLTEAAQFVRSVALTLEPQTSYPVARLTLVLGRYIEWARVTRGLPYSERLLFEPQVIDIFIRDQLASKKLAKSSIASYRSILVRASEVFLPRAELVRPRGMRASHTLAPYTSDEVHALMVWARGQNTRLKKAKAIALTSLGLGCGLHAGEILTMRRGSIVDTGASLVLNVAGGSPRRVPMLHRFQDGFREVLADRDAEDFVFGARQRGINPNAVSEFVSTSGYRIVKPNTYRMRSTWVVGRLRAGVDLPTLLSAAGLDRLEKLGDYLPFLPHPTDATFESLTQELEP
jgi:integrase